MRDGESLEEERKLIPLFNQSWEYIRHSQNMFWQSFAALFTVIVAVTVFVLDKSIELRVVGASSSMILSMMGFFVCSRTIRILKEHFITVNRVRRELGIDDIRGLVLKRWKKYSPGEYRLTRSETLYVLIASQLYLFVFSSLAGHLTFLGTSSLSHQIQIVSTGASVLLVLVALEVFAWKKVYFVREKVIKENSDTSWRG